MGIAELVLYVAYRVYFYFRKPTSPSRFGALYDLTSRSPFENGTIFPEKEKHYEYPESTDDGIQIFAQSNKGQLVLAGIQRIPNDRAIATLYVRLHNGRSFSLGETVLVDSSRDDHFAAGGLKITCLSPMRRWRISFNGMIADTSTGESVHLKLISIGNLAHGCADFQSYHDSVFLAEQLSRRLPFSRFEAGKFSQSLRDLDIFHQRFAFSTKVYVNGEPEELYLFGYKTRNRVTPRRVKKSITAFTENGLSTVVGIADLNDGLQNYIFGYLNFPNRQQRKLQFSSDAEDFFLPGKLYVTLGAENWKSLRLSELRTIEEIAVIESDENKIWRRKVRISEISFDGHLGHALISSSTSDEAIIPMPEIPVCKVIEKHQSLDSMAPTQRKVIPFTDPAASSECLTGGKGSSLAMLTQMALKNNHLFKVPQGVCVTTEAYKYFVSDPSVSQLLDNLETICASGSLKEIREACERAVSQISETALPSEVEKLLAERLSPDLKYAVRSSACGEDSEETSAAGQMETILGVRGSGPIVRAVAKCWASQFSFVAVQYRRRYGQPLRSAMCVVVQEMVASEVAGVMFTVDPVTGDPLKVIVTANYGLGESVVSAAADPDTFVLTKIEGGVELTKQELGEKKVSIVMSENGGTEQVTVQSRQHEACLSLDQLLLLGRTAVALEDGYASPRDTEWAFCDNVLFMLQARPVTSLDQIDTDFEYLHESDSGMDSEIDALSKANVGEVFGGCMSTLSLDVILASMTLFRMGAVTWNGEPEFTYAKPIFLHTYYSQCFFPTFWPNLADYTADDLMSRCFTIAMAGRSIDDDCVLISNRNKRRYMFKGTNTEGLFQTILRFWRSEGKLRRTQTKYKNHRIEATSGSCWELFNTILNELTVLEEGFGVHDDLIFYSSINNMLVLAILSHCNDGEWDTKVFSDFAKLSASSKNVESASVPVSMSLIASQIRKEFGSEFAAMEIEDARKLLMDASSNSQSSELFRAFINDHGHRCLREFDVLTKSWSMDQTPLIRTLQSMVSNKTATENTQTSSETDDDALIDSLSIKIPFLYRPILKFWLKRVRKGIAFREEGKSLCVRTNDILRKRFWSLAGLMVKEGRLPEEDLLFHLSLTEIADLLKSRSPKLLIRAINRRANQKSASSAIYPEHCAGLPLEAVNKSPLTDLATSMELRGTPVREGIVRATVRVVHSLDEADQIEEGDILVTYATDIGWSPYFSLLSGIVTELGGLISHGAVIAREYGLPSIVGVQGATRVFKSGQQVVLDGSKGTISLVSLEENEQATEYTV